MAAHTPQVDSPGTVGASLPVCSKNAGRARDGNQRRLKTAQRFRQPIESLLGQMLANVAFTSRARRHKVLRVTFLVPQAENLFPSAWWFLRERRRKNCFLLFLAHSYTSFRGCIFGICIVSFWWLRYGSPQDGCVCLPETRMSRSGCTRD